MTAAETYMAFDRAPAGLCEHVRLDPMTEVETVTACRVEAQGLWPLPRRMCRIHALRWLDPGFVGCGCGPRPCPACRRHMEARLRVVVVGERENGRRDHPFNSDDRICDFLRRDPDSLRAVAQFHRRRSAFSWGTSRKRLVDLGLRWDLPVNLLGSSPVCGEWDREAARRVAQALCPHLEVLFDRVVLLGVRVAAAFDGMLDRRKVLIPHPSGRSPFWNDSSNVDRIRRTVDVIYSTATEELA